MKPPFVLKLFSNLLTGLLAGVLQDGPSGGLLSFLNRFLM